MMCAKEDKGGGVMERLTREMTFEEEYIILKKEVKELFDKEDRESEPPESHCVVRRALRCIKKLVSEVEQYKTYKDLEEQGLLFRLPCKVGDTVYIIAPKYRDCGREQCDSYDSEQFLKTYCKEYCPNGFKGIGALETVVEYIEINNNDIRIMTKKDGLRNIDTIFLTQAEAEQKLKEMESD